MGRTRLALANNLKLIPSPFSSSDCQTPEEKVNGEQILYRKLMYLFHIDDEKHSTTLDQIPRPSDLVLDQSTVPNLTSTDISMKDGTSS